MEGARFARAYSATYAEPEDALGAVCKLVAQVFWRDVILDACVAALQPVSVGKTLVHRVAVKTCDSGVTLVDVTRASMRTERFGGLITLRLRRETWHANALSGDHVNCKVRDQC